MAREPTRRAEPEPKATEPTKAVEPAAPGAERPKVSLKLGKAAAASVYSTPYGSEPASFDPKTGLRIAPPPKSAA
jgi:hypothetical protein